MAAPAPSFRTWRMGTIAMTCPGATAVFREYGLDFCCSGDGPLGKAANARGLDLDQIERALAERTSDTPTVQVPTQTPALTDHIITHYHEAHRVDLPMLRRLANKVESVHASDPAVPAGLCDTLADMHGMLEEHMAHEELVLFPTMAEGGSPMIELVTEQMREEHRDHAHHWAALDRLTNGFTPPEHACAAWSMLYNTLAKFIGDLMEHVHLENNVLFPRFERTDHGCAGP